MIFWKFSIWVRYILVAPKGALFLLGILTTGKFNSVTSPLITGIDHSV